MIESYVNAVLRVLESFADRLTELALPIAILGGLAIVALYLRARDGEVPKFRAAVPFALFALVFACGWTLLRVTRTVQQVALEDQASADATEKPTSDAPQIYQYSPSAVKVVEKTYTRTLQLPPDFAQRIGADGLGVLSPYLSDPTSENVSKLVDTFRRSGQDVVFTRELTRMDEDPVGFLRSAARVMIKRTEDRGYEATFGGSYTFENNDNVEREVRFVFPLSSNGGTVRNLSLKVGTDSIKEPDDSGNYVWVGKLGAGEQRTAEVSYSSNGSSAWNYDMGSTRRTVREFHLTVDVDGPFRFPRGSIQPSSRSSSSATWDLSNVVTAQRIALAFPKDTSAQEGYLQSLTALPITFAIVLAICFLVPVRLQTLSFSSKVVALTLAAVVFGFALFAVPIVYGYIGWLAAFLCPVLGAVSLIPVLGFRTALLAIIAALVPTAMLSPTNSGLLIVLIALTLAFMGWRFAGEKAVD